MTDVDLCRELFISSVSYSLAEIRLVDVYMKAGTIRYFWTITRRDHIHAS